MTSNTQQSTSGIPLGLVPKTTGCPDVVLKAIYGVTYNKSQAYEASLKSWWTEYSDRKNDEEDEHVADSLLYDRSHLPRTIAAPEHLHEELIAADRAKHAAVPTKSQ